MSLNASNMDVKEFEPQITSNDPSERRLARKLRIERRLESIKKQNMPEDEDQQSIKEQKDIVFQQVQKSADLLEKLMLEGEEYITNVRIANDSREVDRRESEGVLKEKIIEQLDNEAIAAKDMFDEISAKWSGIQKYNDPLQIHEDIANQKEKCDVLIKQKDDLIKMLKDELKAAEIKYSDDQRKQIQDINTLTSRIEKQITLMRKAYQNELEIIENVILNDRQSIIDACDKKWEELYKKRDNEEESNMKKKFNQIELFDQQLTEARKHFQEYYRATKIQLENNVDELEKELERLKALTLLNTEKMDYNYQILKKREDENIIIKSQQKRKINKLQDMINAQRNKTKEYEQTTDVQIKKLEMNIKKLQNYILDVETKADHFAELNDKKFDQIWKMNENEAKNNLKQILAIDKVLFEQLLGKDWIEPKVELLNKSDLNSYKKALKTLQAQSTDEHKLELKDECSMDLPKSEHYRTGLIKQIFMLISEKSGFLAEQKLRTLLQPYEEEQKALVRIDHVFEALKIEDCDAIDMLVEYFLPYMHCPICNADYYKEDTTTSVQRTISPRFRNSSVDLSSPSSSSKLQEDIHFDHITKQPNKVIDAIVVDLIQDDSNESILIQEIEEQINSLPSSSNETVDSRMLSKGKISATRCSVAKFKHRTCINEHPLVISSVYVLQALNNFVENYHKREKHEPTVEERLKRRRDTISRLINEKDLILYWERYSMVFDNEKESIWDVLYNGLHKYHNLLKERKVLCEDVVNLRRQNVELKKLMANYLAKQSNPIECCENI